MLLLCFPWLLLWNSTESKFYLLLFSIVAYCCSLLRSYGIPRFSSQYGQLLLSNESTHFLFFAVIVLTSLQSASLVLIGPFITRSLLFVVGALNLLLPQFSPSIHRSLSPLFQSLIHRSVQIQQLNVCLELVGFLVTFLQLFSAQRSILLLFLLYQYSRFRFIISESVQFVWRLLEIRADQLLLSADSLLPQLITRRIYPTIKSFIKKQGQVTQTQQPHQQQQEERTQ